MNKLFERLGHWVEENPAKLLIFLGVGGGIGLILMFSMLLLSGE